MINEVRVKVVEPRPSSIFRVLLFIFLAIVVFMTAGILIAYSYWQNLTMGFQLDVPFTTNSALCGTSHIVSASRNGVTPNKPLALAVIDNNDAWAVGYTQSIWDRFKSQPLLQHWNGEEWSVATSFDFEAIDSTLYDVSAVRSNDIWAVGNRDTSTLVLHWDGTTWESTPSPNAGLIKNTLRGVAAVSSNDVWAVGEYDLDTSPPRTATLTLHWDGDSWDIVPSPNPGKFQNVLRSISVLANDSIWAVGYYNDGDASYPLILHWNGSIWQVADVPDLSVAGIKNERNDLNSVMTISTDDVWAVGMTITFPRVKSLLMHWNGRAWEIIPNSFLSAQSDHLLSSIHGLSKDDIWAVGATGQDLTDPSLARSALLLHWDGTSWSRIENHSNLEKQSVHRVVGISSKDIWAIGDGDERLLSVHIETNSCTPLETK